MADKTEAALSKAATNNDGCAIGNILEQVPKEDHLRLLKTLSGTPGVNVKVTDGSTALDFGVDIYKTVTPKSSLDAISDQSLKDMQKSVPGFDLKGLVESAKAKPIDARLFHELASQKNGAWLKHTECKKY